MVDTSNADTDVLVRRAAGGDSRAEAEIFERYRCRLRRLVAMRLDRRIGQRVDPSDIVQDVLKTAHERLSDYVAVPQVSFYVWLRQIAWDRIVDAHRRHIRAERRSILRESRCTPVVNDDSVAELAHSVSNSSIMPARRALRAELEARVKAALLELRPHDREILVLRYLEQLNVMEIASVLKVSQTTVTSRHLRALQRLRRVLGSGFGE
jgi:RNA polymerase sigma-70 factor (subfamily 1)